MRFAVELQVLVDKLFRLWYWFCRHYCCLPRPFRSSVHCNFVIFKLSQERVPQIISLVGWHDIRRGKSTSGEKTWYNQSQYLWNEELTEVVSFIWPGVVWIILVCECSPELTLLRGGGMMQICITLDIFFNTAKAQICTHSKLFDFWYIHIWHILAKFHACRWLRSKFMAILGWRVAQRIKLF